MRAAVIAFVAALAMSSTPAAAQSSAALQCASMEDNDSRLACYDGLFRKDNSLSDPAATPPPSGVWTSYESTSQMTDAAEVTLAVNSTSLVPGSLGSSENYAELVVRCQEGTTSAFIIFADHFMSDIGGGGQITYRIDKAPAGRSEWAVSTDNKALGLWSGSRAIPFIKKLFGAQKFLVRALPYNESWLEVEFPVTGLKDAIIPLRKACEW